MAGIISGAMPTAMASEKSSASISGRDSATLTMKMNAGQRRRPPRTGSARTATGPPRRRSGPGFSARPAAICPKAVRVPVRDHHANGRPLVDDRPHECASRLVQRLRGRRRAPPTWPPASTRRSARPSSHSSSSTFSKRTSAGTSVADTQRHHVARHEVGHRDPARSSVSDGPRPPGGSWPAGRSIATSARYSLKKPKTDAEATITAMITALVPPPVSPDTSAAPSRRIRIGFRIWRKQHRGRTHRMRAERVRPEPAQPFRHIVRREPIRPLPESREHLIGRQAGGVCQFQLRGRGVRPPDGRSSFTAGAQCHLHHSPTCPRLRHNSGSLAGGRVQQSRCFARGSLGSRGVRNRGRSMVRR